MAAQSAYRLGQHVRCGARIVEVCDYSPRYGGSYTLRGVWPPDCAGGQQRPLPPPPAPPPADRHTTPGAT